MDRIELTLGCLAKAKQGEDWDSESKELPQNPVVQILGFLPFVGPGGKTQYRLNVSDGEFSCSFVILSPDLNHLIQDKKLEEFAVVRVTKMMCTTMGDNKILNLLSLEVVAEGKQVGKQLGNPIPLNDQGQAPPSDAPPSIVMTSMSISSDPDTLTSDHKCHVCDLPSLKKCTACSEVYYCSVDHQKQDWAAHKLNCGPFRIEQSSEHPSLGKQWVANRDLEAGEVLLNEPVAFYGPWSGADGSTKSPPLCIVCGLYWDVNQKPDFKRYFCSKCGWPVCGLECEQNPVHAGNECSILYEVHGSKSYSILDDGEYESMAFSLLITVLRGALLETKNPKLYQEVLKLQHSTQIKDDYINLILFGPPMMGILKLLQALKISKTSTSDKLYSKIYRINHLNSFCVSTFGHPPLDPMEVAMGGADGQLDDETELRSKQLVYIKASRLNHACIPNCSWTVGPSPDYKIRVRTAVPVKKGEQLTIFYSVPPFHTSQEFPTAMRRGFLSSFNGIHCTCARCSDPTELGTYCCALTCTSCYDDNANDPGYMLPVTPLISGADSPWKCNKCTNIQPFSVMEKHQQDITMGEQMEQENNPHRDVIQTYYNCRMKYGKKLLHPNHLFFLNATLTWLRWNRNEIHDLAEESVLSRSLDWVMECLDFYDKVLPGINSKRARLQMLLAAIMRIKLLQHSSALTPEKLKLDYKIFISASEDALTFYEKDFPRPGDQVSFNAQVIRLRMLQVKNELPTEITADNNI